MFGQFDEMIRSLDSVSSVKTRVQVLPVLPEKCNVEMKLSSSRVVETMLPSKDVEVLPDSCKVDDSKYEFEPSVEVESEVLPVLPVDVDERVPPVPSMSVGRRVIIVNNSTTEAKPQKADTCVEQMPTIVRILKQSFCNSLI